MLFSPIQRFFAQLRVGVNTSHSRASSFNLGSNPMASRKISITEADMSLRLTSFHHRVVQPYIEWRGATSIQRSNNLKSIPQNTPQAYTVGVNFNATRQLTITPQITYAQTRIPGHYVSYMLYLAHKI